MRFIELVPVFERRGPYLIGVLNCESDFSHKINTLTYDENVEKLILPY